MSVAASCLRDPEPVVRSNGLDALAQAAAAQEELVQFPEKDLPTPERPFMYWTAPQKEEVQKARAKLNDEFKLHQPLQQALKGQGPAIAAALEDPELQVRMLARRSLELLGSARLRWLRRVTSIPNPEDGKATRIPDLLYDALEPGLQKVAGRLRDKNLAVRQATLNFLEMMEDAAAPAAPVLVDALGDPDRFVRWQAARILGKIGPVRTDISVPALARLLHPREDSDVRDAAAYTLYLYGPTAKAALPTLAAAVAAGESDARESLIKALVSVGPSSPDVVPPLQEALRSSFPGVRRAAADALGQLGPVAANAVPDLRLMLNDDDPGVRIAVADALVNITRPK